MDYIIISDTSCNVPLARVADEGVTFVPFSYYPKNNSDDIRECIDIDTFDGKKYYDTLKEGALFNTSQVAPQTYFDHISQYAAQGYDVLYVGMSSGISGSYNSSLIAKTMLEDAFPDRKFFMHDSRAASLGEGIALFRAIENRKKGMSIEENFRDLEEFRKSIYQVFTVESLKHLQRTGRLSGVAMIIGTMLNIKPILKGNEFGQIINIAKVRGNKKAIRALADKYNALVKNPGEQVVGIAHADNIEDTEYLIELLNEKNPPKEILTVCYEPVTGTHVGPGTVALFFVGDEHVRFE